MHKKSACEQRVGILTFCQYYTVTYIFQIFITFFHNHRELGRAFTVCLLRKYYFFKQIRTLKTCNLIPGTTIASLFYQNWIIAHFEQISKY